MVVLMTKKDKKYMYNIPEYKGFSADEVWELYRKACDYYGKGNMKRPIDDMVLTMIERYLRATSDTYEEPEEHFYPAP